MTRKVWVTSAESRARFTPAVTVILVFGIISMLGDMVYEAARSVNGQYLSLLSVSAAEIGLVFGVGEFLGYSLRLMAGVVSDRTGKHWLFMFLGYGMLLVVPVMGLTASRTALIAFILMERMGKALRNPAKDTVLSGVARNEVGVGFAFGLQEALDQIGAFAGPLIFTCVFRLTGENGVSQYQLGYRLLAVPFGLLMLFLVHAHSRVRRENLIPEAEKREFRRERLDPVFWLYTAFTFLCALGLVNFGVVGYHLKTRNMMSDGSITLLYSGAMVVDALTALFAGKAYDRTKQKLGIQTGGLLVLAAVPVLTVLLPFLTLSDSVAPIIVGMVVFGIVIGVHETVMRSAIADITPFSKRGTGYGVFNTAYGLALLGGAGLMGLLYDVGRVDIIVAFVCVAEAGALLLFFKMRRMVTLTQK